MEDRIFSQPVLNSPYEYPTRHWELDADGQRKHKSARAAGALRLLCLFQNQEGCRNLVCILKWGWAKAKGFRRESSNTDLPEKSTLSGDMQLNGT